MTKETLSTIAAGLVFVAFALVVWGLQHATWMWVLGLGLTGVAYLFALATQWAREGDPEGSADDENDENEADGGEAEATGGRDG